MTYLEHIKLLKAKTAAETDLLFLRNYFFDHVAENLTAIRKSVPVRDNDQIQTYFALFKGVIKGHSYSFSHLFLLRIEDACFDHGSLQLTNGSLGAVYYYNDIDMGLMILDKGDGITDIFRLNTFRTQKQFMINDTYIVH